MIDVRGKGEKKEKKKKKTVCFVSFSYKKNIVGFWYIDTLLTVLYYLHDHETPNKGI